MRGKLYRIVHGLFCLFQCYPSSANLHSPAVPVLVHHGEHHRDVLHLHLLYVRDEGLTVEGVVGVTDGLGPELCDGRGRPSPQRSPVPVDGDADPGVTVGPVVPARQVCTTLHTNDQLGGGVWSHAGQHREADGRRTLEISKNGKQFLMMLENNHLVQVRR